MRSRLVAHIFATDWLRNYKKKMRRDIFHAMTPNAISERFDITRQSVSKHLRILTECQLLKKEQQGREIYYQLDIKQMKEIDKWLEQFRKIWEDRYSQLDDLLLNIKNKTKK